MLNRTIAKRTLATAAQAERALPKKYGGRFTVTLIPGDGVGKEITDSVKTIFEAEKIPVDWETVNIKQTDHKEGVYEAVESLKRNKIGLKGLWHTPADQTGHGSLNVALRKQLDIYANVALFKSLKGVKTRIPDIDPVSYTHLDVYKRQEV